jgi:drug/metabolite transporter (DMT)-like permease
VTGEWVLAGLVAFLWGVYPLVARTSGYGGPLGALALTAAGIVAIGAVALARGAADLPSPAQLLRLCIAGLLMGAGLVAFNRVVNGPLAASLSIPIIYVAMLIVSRLGAFWIFGEAFNAQQLLALGLMLAGILLMRPA